MRYPGMRRLLLVAVVLVLLVILAWGGGDVSDVVEPKTAPDSTVLEEAEFTGTSPAVQVERTVVDQDEDAGDDSEAVETGTCSLELRFFDAENWAPVSGNVQLWRLHMPETDRWSAGDYL